MLDHEGAQSGVNAVPVVSHTDNTSSCHFPGSLSCRNSWFLRPVCPSVLNFEQFKTGTRAALTSAVGVSSDFIPPETRGRENNDSKGPLCGRRLVILVPTCSRVRSWGSFFSFEVSAELCFQEISPALKSVSQGPSEKFRNTKIKWSDRYRFIQF